MRKAIFLAAALAASAFATTRAEAASWLIAGSGCTVDAADVVEGNYQQFGVGVEFKAGFIGDIVLYCAVTPGEGVVQGAGYSLDLYSDDGGPNSRVTVELFKMELGNGVVTRVETNQGPGAGCNVISSDQNSDVGYDIDTRGCLHTFNPNGFLYFARVALGRAVATQFPRFYGLSIWGGP